MIPTLVSFALVILALLRTVPTIVIAHTFCASRDARISYGWYIFVEKAELSKCSYCLKRKLGITTHFSEIINLQFGKERRALLFIFKLFTNIVDKLSSKNAWLPNFLFGFQ